MAIGINALHGVDEETRADFPMSAAASANIIISLEVKQKSIP
jgi:hypothetical protein